ncbi:glucose-1-phosphate thymidylyltransferase [Chlorobiota bacterium]|jgi:glucose-1-phosphate thymidylyltransferase|nr:glucose-1-phosphate thymidylyltransferase [Chlorobiota bacterium]
MKAIIPVAGVGTRLRPHTYTLPKVLLNVAGKPILGHILDALQQHNIDEATIIVGYMGDLVEDYVRRNYSMNVTFIYQEERLGLGHSIWIAREHITDNEPLLIILGDTIFDVDLSLATNSRFSTLGVKSVDDPRRFGVVELEKGFISRLIEKPENPTTNLALVGLYFINNPTLLVDSLQTLIDNNIRTRDEYQLTDALQMMIDKGEKFTTFPVEGWYDCGKPETLLSTNRYLLDGKSTYKTPEGVVIIPPAFVAENAIVERSVIGPYTTVASGATVIDSVVRDSIISDGATVTASTLEQSIIGNNAIVKGKFSRLNVGDSSEIDRS